MSSSKRASLEASKLGTKEYWDTTYTTDLTNHALDPSDTGIAWFSTSNAQQKIISYLTSLHLPPTTTFLDLGTGNGALLFALREEGGFGGKMLGVDYSPQSVELARRVAVEKGVQGDVEFRVWDILNGKGGGDDGDGQEHEQEQELGEWDVVLDKGTFDAVSLSGVPDVERRYVRRVEELVKKGGLVLVTSCNWTEDEVRRWFEGGGGLEFCGRIEYPTFRFGGATGQAISSVCLRRR